MKQIMMFVVGTVKYSQSMRQAEENQEFKGLKANH